MLNGIALLALLGALAGAVFYSQAIQECNNFPGIGNQSGKVVIVTGGNSGLGYETSKSLAAAGAAVIMACRSPARCAAAREDILKIYPSAIIDTMALDLASFKSVRQFSADFAAKYDHLDVLINNAGIMAIPERELTEDGIESQLGTNHVGHFLLTSLLYPLLAQNARVINHSSEMHRTPSADFPAKDLQSTKAYAAWTAYANSKAANVLFTYELNNRLEAIGNPKNIISIAVHPGYSSTNLQTDRFPFAEYANAAFAMKAEHGALGQIHAAVDVGVSKSNNDYYGPKYYMFGSPGLLPTAEAMWDKNSQRVLWEESLKLIGAQSCFVVKEN